MPTMPNQTKKERCWVFFNQGWIRGLHHSELTVVRSRPGRSVVQDGLLVFTISRTFGWIAALALAAALVLLVSGCSLPRPQKGGQASSSIVRPGHTNLVTLCQPENPKDPSRQTVQSEQTLEYVLPAGTAIALGHPTMGFGERESQSPTSSAAHGAGVWQSTNRHHLASGSALPSVAPAATAVLTQPMPVRVLTKDHTETSIGGAQRDRIGEWAAKAASVQPVMWAGIAMMTLVTGVLVYFGWWTKAAMALAVGFAMVVLAQTLPDHGTVILLAGLGVFGLSALLILYAYYKGQLDQNHNGIPDFLEREPKSNA